MKDIIIYTLLSFIPLLCFMIVKKNIKIAQLEGQRDAWMMNFEDVRNECRNKDRLLSLMQKREKILLETIANSNNEALVKIPPIFRSK